MRTLRTWDSTRQSLHQFHGRLATDSQSVDIDSSECNAETTTVGSVVASHYCSANCADIIVAYCADISAAISADISAANCQLRHGFDRACRARAMPAPSREIANSRNRSRECLGASASQQCGLQLLLMDLWAGASPRSGHPVAAGPATGSRCRVRRRTCVPGIRHAWPSCVWRRASSGPVPAAGAS